MQVGGIRGKYIAGGQSQNVLGISSALFADRKVGQLGVNVVAVRQVGLKEFGIPGVVIDRGADFRGSEIEPRMYSTQTGLDLKGSFVQGGA